MRVPSFFPYPPRVTRDGVGTRVAVDVGGTFVDFVMVDGVTGEVSIEKQPATSEDLSREVAAGLERLPTPIADVEWLLHGSTVVLNALLQERGATVGLVTTTGFRDVLELRRGARPHIYDWLYTPPDPLVPRYLRREVPERTAADGTELVPLDLDALDAAVDALVSDGVEAVAICFLHSYADPKHEQLAAARTRERHPALRVTASVDLASEWREFERTSTAVLNAFVQPTFGRYLDELKAWLRDAGYQRRIAVMQSNGGLIEASRAATLPVRTLMSGPAGGAIGGRALAVELGCPNLVCADVGGTSFDVVLIEDGEILERTETEINGRPVLAPFIDIVSVGAGGGSVAWIDETHALRVGPRSAGARPGPASFGLGGIEPTVTDCQLLLGRLDPETFLGGRMRLDMDAGRRAIEEHVATPLGLDTEEAAMGVITIAETSMSQAIHVLTVERGVDPRAFTLLAYGGGGGLFAAATAQDLEIPRVLVPRAPANFSAWGILSSDYREDASLTRVRPLTLQHVGGIAGDMESLRRQAVGGLAAYGVVEDGVGVSHRLDLRFEGQEHSVTVPIDAVWLRDHSMFLASARERFVTLHRQLYGHGDPDGPIEVVTVRCRGIEAVDRPRWPAWDVQGPAEPRARRP
jgi:N-methylhydantoinase A